MTSTIVFTARGTLIDGVLTDVHPETLAEAVKVKLGMAKKGGKK
jgi:hypothetical protein